MILRYKNIERKEKDISVEKYFSKYCITPKEYIVIKDGTIISSDQEIGCDEIVYISPVRETAAFDIIFQEHYGNRHNRNRNCDVCGAQAVTYSDYIDNHYNKKRMHFCKVCFTSHIEHEVFSIIENKQLVRDGDILLAPLSGGKDGIFEIYLLKLYFERRKNMNCRIIAYTVILHNTEYEHQNAEKAVNFCEKYHIEHQMVDLSEYLKEKMIDNCYNCSTYRRVTEKIIIDRYSVNKVLSGKNLTDFSRQILFEGFIGDKKSKSLSLENVEIISFMYFLTDYDIALYLKLKGINYAEHMSDECPYVDTSFRVNQSKIINMIDYLFPNMIKQRAVTECAWSEFYHADRELKDEESIRSIINDEV